MSVTNNSSNDHMNVVKILVLGESGVGKSLFIRTMCEELIHFTSAMCTSNDKHLTGKHYSAQKSTTGLAIECVVATNAQRRPVSVFPSSNQFANDYSNAINNPLFNVKEQHDDNLEVTSNASLLRKTMILNAESMNNSEQLQSLSNQAVHINTNATCSMPQPSLMASEPQKSEQQEEEEVRPEPMYMIEFHELGGSRSFIPQAELAISLTHYSGIILLYNRHDAQSASGLSEWYAKIKAACRIKSREHPETVALPKIMLVGVELPEPSLLPSLSLLIRLSTFSTQLILHTLQKTCPTVWVQLCNKYNRSKKKWNASDDEDVNHAEGNLDAATTGREFYRNRSLITPLGLLHARSKAHTDWHHYLHKLHHCWICAFTRHICSLTCCMFKFACNPFHLLSPSHASAVDRQARGLLHRLLLWWAYVWFIIYQLLTWGLACLLFGAAQHKYPHSVPLPQHALKLLRANP